MISVIVPAYNEEKVIQRCLDSLIAQEPLPDEIVVVDNASTDLTPTIIRAFVEAHPHVNFKLLHETKQGCVHARETGWRAASGEIIIHVDADEILPPGWLARICATLQQDPDVGAIGGTYRFEQAPPVIAVIQALFNLLYPRLVQLTKGFPYLVGGMTICKRQVLEEMNGYLNKPDDQLEDYYLSAQAPALGYRTRYIPAIYGIHSLRRYEAGGLAGFLHWGVGGLDAKQYDDTIR